MNKLLLLIATVLLLPLMVSAASFYDIHGATLDNSALSNACVGVVFSPTTDINLTGVSEYSTGTAELWYVHNGTYTGNCGDTDLLSSGNFSSDAGNLSSPVSLLAGQNYTFLVSGTDYNFVYGTSSDLPSVGNTTLIDYVVGLSDGTPDNYIRNVQGVYFTSGVPPPPVNNPPVTRSISAVLGAGNTSLTLTMNATDADGDDVQFILVTNNSGSSSSAGTTSFHTQGVSFTSSISISSSGNYSICGTATDGVNESTVQLCTPFIEATVTPVTPPAPSDLSSLILLVVSMVGIIVLIVCASQFIESGTFLKQVTYALIAIPLIIIVVALMSLLL